MAGGIEQGQPSARILQTYARPTFVCRCFGVIGVLANEVDGVSISIQADVNKRGPVAVDTVLESVLHERQ